jgi:hypothetical protein
LEIEHRGDSVDTGILQGGQTHRSFIDDRRLNLPFGCGINDIQRRAITSIKVLNAAGNGEVKAKDAPRICLSLISVAGTTAIAPSKSPSWVSLLVRVSTRPSQKTWLAEAPPRLTKGMTARAIGWSDRAAEVFKSCQHVTTTAIVMSDIIA